MVIEREKKREGRERGEGWWEGMRAKNGQIWEGAKNGFLWEEMGAKNGICGRGWEPNRPLSLK